MEKASPCTHPQKEPNAMKCRLCGDIIHSKFRHDYVQCECGAISLDGGYDYCRMIGDPENFLLLTDDEKSQLLQIQTC